MEGLHLGDCLDILKTLPDNSADSVVTDPPYELGFMGKSWDATGIAYNVDMWREVLRVLKPGAHLLSFGGTRTYHRMACAIEDAGFEIRDQIQWIYGSGFPKSHNLKDEWKGWGTALKPANEPICLARKPLSEKTVASNVLKWGTGAINVDGCRVSGEPWSRSTTHRQDNRGGSFHAHAGDARISIPPQSMPSSGRWPANLIHDGSEEVVGMFPSTGASKSGGKAGWQDQYVGGTYKPIERTGYDEPTGSAARFFYSAKASKKDRDEGLEEFAAKSGLVGNKWTDQDYRRGDENPNVARKNHHPTVKPTELMRYLCRLITPPGGIVLDPFMGSGSTGKAAARENLRFIGIEKQPEYYEIASARIRAVKKNGTLPL